MPTPCPPAPAAAAPATYVGRFAPSPTGPLQAGSLVAALASWLDARAHGGQWLVRIEDIDPPRCAPGAERVILQQLAACGLRPDQPPVRQSDRHALYAQALSQLVHLGLAYGCACTRKDIEAAWARHAGPRPRHQAAVYPGTCRHGLNGRDARAWRFRTDLALPAPCATGTEPAQTSAACTPNAAPNPVTHDVVWTDRRLGPQSQDVTHEVGDFVLRRADGLWAYQLAVVVDDGAQGVTDIVRGEDLCDNTARQILLQEALGLPRPRYLHTPLVRDARGEKLSKQHGAPPIDTSTAAAALQALNHAAQTLGLPPADPQGTVEQALQGWIRPWAMHHAPERSGAPSAT